MTTRVSYIINGVVIDIVDLADIKDARKDVVVVEGVGSNIGDTWDGKKFTPPVREEIPVVPSAITRRQCAKQMKAMSIINSAEALAMTKTGDAPAMVVAMLAGLPQPTKDDILIDFAADTYLRGNPLLNQLMVASGHTEADIDQFFIAAALL